MFDSFRQNNKILKAEIYAKTTTLENGVPSVSWSLQKTLDCLFWRGSKSYGVVSDKIKADVDAVFCFKGSEQIADSSKIKLKDKGTEIGEFDVITADDIGQQGVITIVPVKEFK